MFGSAQEPAFQAGWPGSPGSGWQRLVGSAAEAWGWWRSWARSAWRKERQSFAGTRVRCEMGKIQGTSESCQIFHHVAADHGFVARNGVAVVYGVDVQVI